MRNSRISGSKMRTLTFNNSALLAALVTLTAAACNSLVGLDDLSVSEDIGAGSNGASQAGSDSHGGGKSNGNGHGKGTSMSSPAESAPAPAPGRTLKLYLPRTEDHDADVREPGVPRAVPRGRCDVPVPAREEHHVHADGQRRARGGVGILTTGDGTGLALLRGGA